MAKVTSKKAVKKIKKKAAKKPIAKPIKFRPAPAAKKAAKPARAPADTAPRAVLIPFGSKQEYINEATTMRMHLIYFRRALGPADTSGLPEWAQVGAERIGNAVFEIEKFPGMEPWDYDYVGMALERTRKDATSFAASLAKMMSNRLNRSAKATDRKANEDWYELADQAMDAACLQVELFTEKIASDEPDEPASEPASEPPVADTEAAPSNGGEAAVAPVVDEGEPVAAPESGEGAAEEPAEPVCAETHADPMV